ncbi:MAG: protein kinase [Sandaracinaceae bacterium]|nr:protein kinase [Sandaracinaceae bacterium]
MRFEVGAWIGQGGMGDVFRATELDTGRVVALKRMRADEAGAARFAREAALLARVRHPALVEYVAHGVDAGVPYLAMEWIDGETLGDRLAGRGLTLGESITIARRLASALAALHAGGVVHRDVKPANVMLRGGDPGDAVLLDLGIARSLRGSHVALTRTNALLGTVGYMAPEQARSGRDVGPPADVFALGCLLFECVTGEPLFAGEHAIEILSRLLSETPRRVRSSRPEVPASLDELVASLLERDVRARPSDGAAVLVALERLGEIEADLLEAPAPVPRMTYSERRLSVVMVVALRLAAEGDATVAEDVASRELADVIELARAHAAQVAPLGLDALAVAVDARGTPADQAEAALTLADAIVAAHPTVRVGVASGLEIANDAARGGMLRRAAALVATPGGDAIVLDATTRELLGARGESPFVGRERELARLDAVFAEALADGAPRGVRIVADPGMGKSRLVERWAAQSRARTLRARASMVSAGTPLQIVRDLVRAAIGAGDHDALREYARARAPAEDAERLADLLGELAQRPLRGPGGAALEAARSDGELRAYWLRRTAIEWLRAETRRGPLVLIVEDLQWGDEPSLEILGESLEGAHPLVLVTTERPEPARGPPPAWPAVEELRLGGLPTPAAASLVAAALRGDASDELVASVIARAQGNPLFLEELARHARERRGETLPASVLSVLEARLARLDPETRRVLRAASVLGERALVGEIAAVAVVAEAELRAPLTAALRDGILRRDDAPDAYRFSHALVRDAVYTTLPDDEVQAAHARAAAWLRQQTSASARVVLYHLERAGDPAACVPWLLRAALEAYYAGSANEIVSLARRGLALGAHGPDAGRLHAIASVGLALALRHDEAITEASRALETLAPEDELWFVAASTALMATFDAADLAANAVLVPRVVANAGNARGRHGAAGVYSASIVLAQAGANELAQRLVAGARARFDAPVERAWLGLSEANALARDGAAGACERLAEEACALAVQSGDEHCVHTAELLLVSLRAGLCDLGVMEARVSGRAGAGFLGQFYEVALAAAAARRDGDPTRLHELASTGTLLIREHARALAAIDACARGLPAQARRFTSAPSTSGRLSSRLAVVDAYARLRAGDAAGALVRARALRAEVLAGSGVYVRETLFTTLAQGCLATGDVEGAREAAREGIAQLARTLDGASVELSRDLGDFFVVRELRDLAAALDALG